MGDKIQNEKCKLRECPGTILYKSVMKSYNISTYIINSPTKCIILLTYCIQSIVYGLNGRNGRAAPDHAMVGRKLPPETY